VFHLHGKAKTVAIHELLGSAQKASAEQQTLFSGFKQGLQAFHQKQWDEAISAFRRTLAIYRADGPSIFYLKLCDEFKTNPPPAEWDGTVIMDRK